MTGDEVERVWRVRLQRCERQLKAKEDELGRQSHYFDELKHQLHHKLSLARDREEILQKHIYALEKQLLDMTVSAAIDVAALSAARIVPRTERHWREPGAREECEGEEENNEGRSSQWQPSNGEARDGRQNKGISENQRNADNKLSSNEVRLQSFIMTLQEDLKVLLEREESGLQEHRRLIEQLQESQENSLFLSRKVEEMKVELQQLNLSESTLTKEVEELRVENDRLKHDLKGSTQQTPSQSSAISADVCSSTADSCPILHPTDGSSEKVLDLQDAVSDVHHQAAAATSKSATQSPAIPAKDGPLYSSTNDSPSLLPRSSLQILNLASETIEEWGSPGVFNVEDTHSEESEALREAYMSLGLGEDLQNLREQCEHLEAALEQSKQQLQVLAHENVQLKVQLRNQREELNSTITSNVSDASQSSPVLDDVSDPDGLLHALNQENRALALHIKELLAHIELSEEEMKSERSHLRANILRLEEDKAKMEQQKQEQGGLITELTRKTEDDLNTIMELRQKIEERVPSQSSDQVEQVTESIQSLKAEKMRLSDCVETLRKEQRELLLTVQTQSEEKQHLTRTIWAIKEEKDGIARSLDGLKQERDQIIRVVSGLKDVQVRLSKSLSDLKEKKKKLTESMLVFEEEKEKPVDPSSRKEKVTQIALMTQHVEREEDQLSLEKESVQESLDKPQPCHHLQEDHDGLLKSINNLKDEKERTEHSLRCLKQEEAQIIKSLQSQKIKQESSELLREIEVVRGELKTSQQELDQRHAEATELRMALSQSETRREHAERKAAQAGDEVKRVTDFMNQMEKTYKENGHLTTQVKELQNKVCVLVKEKAATLSLKSQIEDQHKIVTAQLKAKTVALEELNLEYIALKKGRDNKDDLSALMSLRTRYNEILAKYDALQKTKSQTDEDLIPLKAKLSCLVLKCQERNSLLAQMMKALHRHKIADFTLTQRVDELLRDPALLEYTAAFAPGSFAKGQDCELMLGFVSKFPIYKGGQTQKDSDKDYGEQKRTKHAFWDESTTNIPNSGCGVTHAPTVQRKQNANSSVPTEQEVNQLSPSSVNEVQRAQQTLTSPSSAEPEKKSLDIKPEAFPGPTNKFDSSRSILSPAPPISVGHVSVSRRMSSPEKIINLQEQLQQTLLSSCKDVEARARVEHCRRKSSSAPESPDLASQKNLQGLSVIAPPSGPHPLFSASNKTRDSPPLTIPSKENQPTTLFSAVTTKSANMSSERHLLSNRHFKRAMSATSCATNSTSTAASSKTNFTSNSDSDILTSLKQKREISPDVAEHSSQLMTSKTTDPGDFMYDTKLKSTASDITAPTKTTAHKADVFSRLIKPNGADPPAWDGLEFTTFKLHSAQHSPECSSKKSHVAPERMRPSKPKPDAPAEVRFVEVIKQVGQSSLLIGWERPPLDELGCSNGTFVYGYRVFVDGEFYKSVMSSACTKCVLENMELIYPVEIGVQTLGSNGLSSNSVHTVYTPPAWTRHL